MTKHNSRTVLAAGLLCLTVSLTASAETFILNSLSLRGLPQLELPVPKAAVLRENPGVPVFDAAENALTPAQWEEVFASREDAPPQQNVTKELFSDFASRYVINGTLQLESAPPTFTTLDGKIYKVVKFPKWLRNVGSAKLCVEGYIRQQDNTSELSIATVLPLHAADAYAPSAATKAVQRQPYIISKNAGSYTLGNVNWGVQHSAKGERLKRADGIFKFVWPKGVTVKPDFLEQAYVGKKSMQSFPYAGVHGFLAFKFKPGGVTDENGNSVKGLVISLNTYSLIPGVQNQGVMDGLRGKYAVHYNINSAEGYVEANVFTDGNRIALYPLKLSRERQLKLLENAIQQAAASRNGEMYSLIYNSCTNAVVSFINSVLPKDEKIVDGWLPEIIYRLRATIPDAATTLLAKRGLVGKPLPYVDETSYTGIFGK